MSALLLLGAAGFVIYSVVNIWSRPGLFGAVYLLTYGLAVFFGSIGPIAGALSIIASFAAISADKSAQKLLLPEYFLLSWIGMQALSLFTTPQIDITMVYVGSVVLLAGGSYLYARAFSMHPRFFDDLLLGGIIVTAASSFQILRTVKAIEILGDSQGFSHVGLAIMPELCLAGIVAFLFFHRGHSRLVAVAILLFAFGVLLPVTLGLGTRSIILSVGMAFIVLLGYRIHQGGAARMMLTILGVFATLAASIMIFWYQIEKTPLGRIITMGSTRLTSGVATGDVGTDKSALMRLQLYQEAWDLFYQAPLIGNGAGSFGYLADNAEGAYPHNMFLEILVQSGLVGVILFMAFCVPLALGGFSNMLKRNFAWGSAFALTIFISAIVRHQVSMSITQGKLLFFALGCFAAQEIAQRRTTNLAPSTANVPDVPLDGAPP